MSDPGLGDLRERMAALEVSHHYELGDLRRRVDALEHSSPLLPAGMSSTVIIKLLLAVCLPLLVLVATGDPQKAAQAVRLLPP